MFNLRRLSANSTLALIVFSPMSAVASTYDALCGGSNCQINVSGRGIGGPEGFIPTELVSKWSVGQSTGYNGGKGVAGGLGGATAGAVAGAVLLGPIGLLGGLIGGGLAGSGAGKEFEGYFTIAGYNKKGKKIAHSFYFINPKPAIRLRSSLPSITGLGMGEERTTNELEIAYANIIPNNNVANDNSTLKGRLEEAIIIEKQVTTNSLPSQLGQSAEAKTLSESNCWSNHLLSNPSLKAWAEANPRLADTQRVKEGYVICANLDS